MLTLNKFGLSNFRVFKEYTEFEFAPLTILTGANNSGKSSLLKALLLIQDNAKNSELNTLEFTSDIHLLGNFHAIKNNISSEESISFSLSIDPFENERKLFGYDENTLFNLEYIEELQNVYLKKLTICSNKTDLICIEKKKNAKNLYSCKINYQWFINDFLGEIMKGQKELKANDKQLKEKGYAFGIRSSRSVEYFRKELDSLTEFDGSIVNREILQILFQDFKQEEVTDFIHIFQERIQAYFDSKTYQTASSYPISSEDFLLIYHANGVNPKYLDEVKTTTIFIEEDYIRFKKMINRLDDLSYYALDYFIYSNFNNFYELILKDTQKLIEELNKSIISNFTYVSAIKANTQRLYTYHSQGTSFNELLVKYTRNGFKNLDFINKWLGKDGFAIADKVEFITIGTYGNAVKVWQNGRELELADLGFGISQLLPLLMQISLCNTKWLILEEPETNLHPSLQARLADLLIDAHRTFEIQFIVETHSEYLIRRMQVLTAKYEEAKRKEQDTSAFIAPNESVIYYFYEPNNVPNGRKQVERINILEDGRLDNDFGDGFIDEASSLQFDLSKLKSRLNKA